MQASTVGVSTATKFCCNNYLYGKPHKERNWQQFRYLWWLYLEESICPLGMIQIQPTNNAIRPSISIFRLTCCLCPILWGWQHQDVAHWTWPYHLSRWRQRNDAMSSMPSFCSGEAEGVSSLFLMPQMQQIMVQSLRQSCYSSGLFGLHFLLPWSTAEWTQASYTLLHILGERCLVVRTGQSCLNFPQATQHLAAMALSQPPPEHSMSPR